MRTITVYVTTGYAGAENTETFEVPDDMSDEEISEIAQEYIQEMTDSGWYDSDEGEN